MSPQATKISEKQKTVAATRNDFFVKYLTSDVVLKIPISAHHCILLIGIISNGNLYE